MKAAREEKSTREEVAVSHLISFLYREGHPTFTRETSFMSLYTHKSEERMTNGKLH